MIIWRYSTTRRKINREKNYLIPTKGGLHPRTRCCPVGHDPIWSAPSSSRPNLLETRPGTLAFDSSSGCTFYGLRWSFALNCDPCRAADNWKKNRNTFKLQIYYILLSDIYVSTGFKKVLDNRNYIMDAPHTYYDIVAVSILKSLC